MGLYLHAKFEVSSIILTGFRQRGGEGNLTPPLPENEPLKSPTRLGLNDQKLLARVFQDISQFFVQLIS